LVLQEAELLEAEVFISEEEDESARSITSDLEGACPMSSASPQYVGLGFDNCWYMFSGGSVSSVYSNSLLRPMNLGECVGTLVKERLQVDPPVWKNAGKSGSSARCAVWNAESQADTLAWASQIPPIQELSNGWQVLLLRWNRETL
jgi:hypothetical protein